MKVILQQDIRGKGKRGQMIEVSDGYARNYMLPRKLAVEATADNVNTMRMNDKAMQEKRQREREEASAIAARMRDLTVTVFAKGGGAGRLFGSVTTQEIADALKQSCGIELDRRKLVSRSRRRASIPSAASSAMRSRPIFAWRSRSSNTKEEAPCPWKTC